MTALRQWLASLIEDNWNLAVEPDFYFNDERIEATPRGPPVIKVYQLPDSSKPRGAGYSGRKVWHNLVIDLKTMDMDNGEAYLAEVERILWAFRISPTPAINHIDWNVNPRGGNAKLYWWTLEVKLYEPNKQG